MRSYEISKFQKKLLFRLSCNLFLFGCFGYIKSTWMFPKQNQYACCNAWDKGWCTMVHYYISLPLCQHLLGSHTNISNHLIIFLWTVLQNMNMIFALAYQTNLFTLFLTSSFSIPLAQFLKKTTQWEQQLPKVALPINIVRSNYQLPMVGFTEVFVKFRSFLEKFTDFFLTPEKITYFFSLQRFYGSAVTQHLCKGAAQVANVKPEEFSSDWDSTDDSKRE